ncbi:MAG TPA: hypothetical protein PKZ52_18190, partial [Cellvibrionaceae bacterium]|nr:hypothetical protein [Cellvibrionaceae bacterium]
MAKKILLGVYLTLSAVHIQAGEIPSFIKTEHIASLKSYLIARPNLILMPESACTCDTSLAQLRKEIPNFQPYYAIGDFNRDKIDDFAIALSDTNKPSGTEPTMTVVIFHGPFNKTPKKAIEVVKDYAIKRPKEVISAFNSRLEAGHLIPGRLDLGPAIFGSDDIHMIIYDTKTQKYR